MLELTSDADMLRLENNPTYINPANYSLETQLVVSYSSNTRFPMNVHLLAQTSNLNQNALKLPLTVEVLNPCLLSTVETAAGNVNMNFTILTPSQAINLASANMFKKSISTCALAFSLSSSEKEENWTTLESVSVAGSRLLINFPKLSNLDTSLFSFYLMARISPTSIARARINLIKYDGDQFFCSKETVIIKNKKALEFIVSEATSLSIGYDQFIDRFESTDP